MDGETETGQLYTLAGKFKDAWEFLRSEDRADYWEFASADAQNYKAPKGPRKPDDVYDGLCAAIHNQEHKPKRSAIVGLPRATKRLSSDELQRAVRRLRDRLLHERDAEEFLTRAYCRWAQLSRTDALVACLTVLKCGHDEVGNLVGPIPEHTPDSAQAAVIPLARTVDPYDLAVICSGLALNRENWSPLWTCVPQLLELSAQRPVSVVLPGSETRERTAAGTEASAAPDNPREGVEEGVHAASADGTPGASSATPDFDALNEDFQALRVGLQEALEAVLDDRLPELDSVARKWSTVRDKFYVARDFLQLETDSFRELQEKARLRSDDATQRAMLDRLGRLAHKTDIGYSAHRQVLTDVRRAVDLLQSGQGERVRELFPGLEAVDSLVRDGGELDEAKASAYDEVVRAAYGNLLAVTLHRGRLTFDGEPSQQPESKILSESLDPKPALKAELTAAAPSSRAPAEAATDTGAEHIADTATAPGTPESGATASFGVITTVEAGEQISATISEPGLPKHIALDDYEPPQDAPDQPSVVEQIGRLPYTPTFLEFKSQTWVGQSGRVETAPWTRPDFFEDLSAAATQAWDVGHFAKAYVCAKASRSPSKLNISDLDATDRLLDRPIELPSLRDPERAVRLRAALEGVVPIGPTLPLALTLEALAPTFPTAWSLEEVQQLCERAALRTPALASVLAFTLTGWSSTGDPLSLIRTFSEAAPASPAQLLQKLQSAQSELQRVVATQWNAAGGRIMRTHCKKAWMSFVRDHVAPLRDALAPLKNTKASTELPAQSAALEIAALGKAFTTIMNDGGVRHADFSAAQSSAYQIVAAIERVVDVKSQLEASKKKTPSPANFPRLDIEHLLSDLPSHSVDRLCVLMLRAAWTQRFVCNPLRLPASQLRSSPELVRAISTTRLANIEVAAGISVNDLDDPLLAAALLASDELEQVEFPDISSLFEHLREYGIERDRADILAALVPAGCLAPHEVAQLGRRALEFGDRAFESTRQLETVWAACDVLVSPQATDFRRFVEEAYTACSFAAGDAPIAQTMFLQAWLDRGLEEARRALGEVIRVRVEEAQRSSRGFGAQFKALIEAQDYRAAMELAHPDEAGGFPEESQVRRTMWRSEAVRKFPNPRATLVSELKGATSEQSSLVSWWVTPGENNQNYRDTLRRSLYNVISGEAGHAQEVNKRRFGGKLAELRQHKERKTVIYCAILREWFQLTRLNPTFLPQLADFDEIALASLPTTAQAGNAVDIYVRAAASEGPRVLSVFLEPNVSPGRRDEVASGLRKRQVPAVILDDIDICRLCVIGAKADAHDFIPFLEIVFEQLDLELISPFSTLDGQHVRLESFVGRQQSAEAIAHRWEYSRLFSGRKLGKSAFLRYVASRYDGEKLLSSKSLHVLFISIAGGSSPEWVVDTIIGEMNKRFSLWFEAESNALKDSVDRFSAYMKRFAEARKDKNVLVILDEADAFVEEQLRRYEQERDRSLSFNMMKRMPESEHHGMPRVRFLFAGYRVTNTRGGVWANAGEVLILKPLGEGEATTFLRGMLCRIGVDIGNHATFAARRCGYQPAVLIRFGDALLKRIRRNSRSPSREHYVVTHEDVLATMSDPAVMEEIRTVVNNNFQGNRVAAAVFAATLLALKDLEPGMALEDGPKHVLAKLRSIDPDIEWLASRGSDPLAQVERQLQEFVDRELLTVSDGPRFGAREYRLKFPNFGPVLGQQDLALEIKQHVHFLASDGAPSRLVESVLPDTSLDAIRYVFRESTAEECALAITAGHWCEALMDEKAGIADRLGFSTKAVSFAADSVALRDKLQTYRIFRAVSAEMLPEFVQAKHDKPLLLLGGVDLLRAALKRQLEGSDTTIDVRPFGPISRSALAWWFEDVQAHVFKRPEFVDQIFEATLGIPLLVGEFARCLTKPPSEDVTSQDLAAALAQFRSKIPEIAQALIDGLVTVRLTARELDLLRMVREVVAELQPAFDLQAQLRDAWELCAVSGPLPPFSDEQDRISLQLLLCLGLLPADKGTAVSAAGDLGRVSVDKNSTLFELLNALGPVGEA